MTEPEPQYVDLSHPAFDWTQLAQTFGHDTPLALGRGPWPDIGEFTAALTEGKYELSGFHADLPEVSGSYYTSSGPFEVKPYEWATIGDMTVIVDRKTKSKRHPIVYGHVADGPHAGKKVVIDAVPTRWRRLRRWTKNRSTAA